MKIDISLEQSDIKSIELDDIEYSDGYYHYYISFDNIEVNDIQDNNDNFLILISGHFNKGGWSIGSGTFKGKLIIYKNDELLEELANHKLEADYMEFYFRFGEGEFEPDADLTLSENVENLIDESNETCGDGNFGIDWYGVISEKSKPLLLDKLKQLFPTENFENLDEFDSWNRDSVIGKLQDLDIITDWSFNDKFDDSLGKIILPDFIEHYTGYTFDDPDLDLTWEIEGKPYSSNNDVDFSYAYIYTY